MQIILKKLNLEPISKFDTAGSAKELQQTKEKTHGVIASSMSAEIYDLQILDENFADYEGNVTRFIILSKTPTIPSLIKINYILHLCFLVLKIFQHLYIKL